MPTVRQETFFDPRCPFCAEKVHLAARVCPHCRSDLAASPQFQAASKQKESFAIVAFIVSIVFLAVVAYFFFSILGPLL